MEEKILELIETYEEKLKNELNLRMKWKAEYDVIPDEEVSEQVEVLGNLIEHSNASIANYQTMIIDLKGVIGIKSKLAPFNPFSRGGVEVEWEGVVDEDTSKGLTLKHFKSEIAN